MKTKFILMGLLSMSVVPMFAAQETYDVVRRNVKCVELINEMMKARYPEESKERGLISMTRKKVEELIREECALDLELINHEISNKKYLAAEGHQPTLLMDAAYEGDIPMVELLLELGASALYRANNGSRARCVVHGRSDALLKAAAIESLAAKKKERGKADLERQAAIKILAQHDAIVEQLCRLLDKAEAEERAEID